MNKLMITLALAAALCGCRSVEVVYHGTNVATVENADGTKTVLTDPEGKPVIIDLGWEAEYFMHWTANKFDAMDIQAGKDVSLSINKFEGGADPAKLVELVDVSLKGAAELAAKIGAAIVTSGGSVAGEAGSKALKDSIASYLAKGGNAAKATVSCKDGSCIITDGTVTETCADCVDCPDGKCAD